MHYRQPTKKSTVRTFTISIGDRGHFLRLDRGRNWSDDINDPGVICVQEVDRALRQAVSRVQRNRHCDQYTRKSLTSRV